ncbi:hypothetical protein METP3_03199 [Methanosarcinales archaeon]|nr:hypothetical protein METP3_03199 [Methanosarcinales archaeon]
MRQIIPTLENYVVLVQLKLSDFISKNSKLKDREFSKALYVLFVNKYNRVGNCNNLRIYNIQKEKILQII